MANTIIGIGKSGCKVLNSIRAHDKTAFNLIAIDTDQDELDACCAEKNFLIGEDVVEGRGTGGNTTVGEKAAKAAMDDILAEVETEEKIHIITGSGGGTGAGATPVIAKTLTSKNMQVSIIAVEPFESEGKRKISRSEKLLTTLDVKKACSTLLVISSDIALEKTKSEDKAFEEINDVIYKLVSGNPAIRKSFINNDKSFENKCTASDLSTAIEYGDEKGAIRLLSNGADPNEVVINGNLLGTTREPLLYKAVIKKMEKLISLLIKRGADVDAAFSGIDRNGNFEKPILFCAILAEDENMVQLLLKCGANPNCSYRKNNQFGESLTPALCQAIKMKNKNIVKMLIESGASVDALSVNEEQYGKNVTPAIFDVIEWNDEEILDLFSCHSVNPNVNNIKNFVNGQIVEPALFTAVEKGRELTARMLMDRGADVNAVAISKNELGNRRTPVLYEAISKGLNETASYMIRLGANVNAERKQSVKQGEEYESVLYKSVVMHNEQIAVMLLERGCNTNTKLTSVDKYGPKIIPAFYEAVVWGNVNLINIMLSKGADVDSELRKYNEYGLVIDPVLFRAVDAQKLSIAKVLIRNGSNVNAKYTIKGIKSIPTLYKAIHWDDIELVKLMISKGADVNSVKINGSDRRTVLWESIYYNKLPIANLLKLSGADITLIPKSECERLYNDYKLHNIRLIEKLKLDEPYINLLDTNGLINLLESEKLKVNNQMAKFVNSSDEQFRINETRQLITEELSRLRMFANLFKGSGIVISSFTVPDYRAKHSKKNESNSLIVEKNPEITKKKDSVKVKEKPRTLQVEDIFELEMGSKSDENKKREQIVKMLIKSGAKTDCYSTLANGKTEDILHTSIKMGKYSIAEILVAEELR